MRTPAGLRTVLSGLAASPHAGIWWRAVAPAFRATVASTSYTKSARSRFSAGAGRFQLLYLAEDPVVAQAEYGALLGKIWAPGSWMLNPARTPVLVSANVNLSKVADLTDPTVQATLHTTAQEVTGDWDGYNLRGRVGSVATPTGDAPTQSLGEALHATGFDGAIAISARIPYARVLLVFPGNLEGGSNSVLFSGLGPGDAPVPIAP